MKPDSLVSLSAPKSIDLVSAAKTQTRSNMQMRDTREYERFGLRVTKLLDPDDPRDYRGPRARGRNTFVGTGQRWSLAELGQAAHGVPEIAFLAACYSFAGASGHFARLHDALHAEALKLRRRLSWPLRVIGTDGKERGYLPELAELVLHEDARPSIFTAAPTLFASYLGVTQELWEGRIEDRYAHVKQAYHLWLSDAYRIMAPRLREEWEGVDEDAVTP